MHTGLLHTYKYTLMQGYGTYVVGSKIFGLTNFLRYIKTNLLFFSIVSLYFNTLFN
jgi:hypothetical protein